MFTEVHTFYYDSSKSLAGTQDKDLYVPHKDTTVINTECIRQVIKMKTDGTVQLSRIKMSDDYHDDIIIPQNEADQITKKLLAGNDNDLAKEVHTLSVAVRELWNLLRARLH